MQAASVAGHPDDLDYLAPRVSKAGEGWDGIFGFFDGIRGITDRVTGITGDLAESAGNITDGRRVVWKLDADKEAFDTDQTLEKLKVSRGDNKVMYYVVGASAVALIAIAMR